MLPPIRIVSEMLLVWHLLTVKYLLWLDSFMVWYGGRMHKAPRPTILYVVRDEHASPVQRLSWEIR